MSLDWDELKLKAMIDGDKHAQEECYIAFSPLLYTTIFKICNSREAANDLLHDTFIDIFNSISAYNSQHSLIAWLKRIAINNTFNYIKRQKVALKAVTAISADEVTQAEPESSELLEHLLYMLPPEHRMVIWLYVVEQYSHAEIANIMDKSESFSKSIVARSLEKFRARSEVKNYGTY